MSTHFLCDLLLEPLAPKQSARIIVRILRLTVMRTTANLSPETLLLVLEQTTDCVKLLSLDGTVLWMNANGLCAMEIDNFCNVEGKQWSTLWPAEARAQIENAYVFADSGDAAQFEAFCPTAKGTDRWWDVRVTQVKAANGHPAGYLSLSRDITEARATRHALDLTLNEMRHRLGNTYSIAGGLLSAFARGIPDREVFARDMQKRLLGLYTAQSMFAHNDAPRKICDLIPALIQPFAGQIDTVNVGELTDALVDRGQADAIGLVLAELTVNSIKHGALRNGGTIDIHADSLDDANRIIWTERLTEPVKQQSRAEGQGLTLIAQIVAARSGKLDIDWSEFGLTVTLAFQRIPAPTDLCLPDL